MIKPLQLGDGIMTDETKEFASIEDATMLLLNSVAIRI